MIAFYQPGDNDNDKDNNDDDDDLCNGVALAS